MRAGGTRGGRCVDSIAVAGKTCPAPWGPSKKFVSESVPYPYLYAKMHRTAPNGEQHADWRPLTRPAESH
ncbi:hypothetical protein BO443_10256 [Burkholderia orbicola]